MSMTMKIASWNVNSLNVRLPHTLQWLEETKPDVLGIQETKLTDDKFPEAALREAGYHSLFIGQKTYNGVALLSREPGRDLITAIPGFADEQKRVIAASFGDIRVINLYVVNGKAVGDEKYAYKMHWLDAVRRWVADEMHRHSKLVVMGDFNIAPDDRDVHDPAIWNDESIHSSSAERRALAEFLDLGLSDSFRLHEHAAGHFSWWDYRQAAFRRDLGLRIDLLLISHALRERCVAAGSMMSLL